MQTSIDFPDAIYQQIEQLAQLKGYTLQQFVVEVLETKLSTEQLPPRGTKNVALPLIHSGQPGTLNLSSFDFDDLLS